MQDFQEQCQIGSCDSVVVIIYFKTMYNKTIIIRFGFCDIRNNQGRDKCYQPSPEPKPKAEADNTYRDHDYLGYHKNQI